MKLREMTWWKGSFHLATLEVGQGLLPTGLPGRGERPL